MRKGAINDNNSFALLTASEDACGSERVIKKKTATMDGLLKSILCKKYYCCTLTSMVIEPVLSVSTETTLNIPYLPSTFLNSTTSPTAN